MPRMDRGMITVPKNGTMKQFAGRLTHETKPKRYTATGSVNTPAAGVIRSHVNHGGEPFVFSTSPPIPSTAQKESWKLALKSASGQIMRMRMPARESPPIRSYFLREMRHAAQLTAMMQDLRTVTSGPMNHV